MRKIPRARADKSADGDLQSSFYGIFGNDAARNRVQPCLVIMNAPMTGFTAE
jgi:hypothetical protein